MATLTHSDYKVVLKYYGIYDSKMSAKKAQAAALDILANKLCRCIKKVGDDKKAIAVCKDSVLGKKGLKNGRFSCKKNAKFLTDKKNKQPLFKTRKRLAIKNKRKTRSKRNSRVNKIKRGK